MPLGNRTNTKYLSIIGNKVCRRVKEGTEGAVKRLNKLNVEVWEIQYDFVEGIIESIATKEGDFGKQWIIELWDGKERFTLQMPYSGRIAKAFLCCLPNVNLKNSVTLQPSVKTGSDGVERQSLFVSQDGTALKWAFTKDNPNGLPPMKQIKVKGKDTWDDSEQLAFLEEMMEKKLSSKMSATQNESVNKDEPERDDLPF